MEKNTEAECGHPKLDIMKKRLKQRFDESAFGVSREQRIVHGLKLTTSISFQKSLTDMCFCKKTQEYLVLDRGLEVLRFSMQGKPLQPSFALEPSMNFGRMFWCDDDAQCLVAYEPEDEVIWLLSCKCENLKPPVKNDFRIKAIYYEASDNKIVVVGSDRSVKYALEDKELEASKPVTYSDPEFGPTWQLEYSSLVPRHATESLSRLIASYLTTLYLLPLEIDKNADDDEDGENANSRRRTNASPAAITAVLWCQPSSWIITGDQQGNVRAYNLSLECTMSRDEAHETRLTLLGSHPSVCGFLSCARDKLQVWCCNFRDTIETFAEFGETPVVDLAVNRETASVVVFAATKLAYLTMHQLYCFFAPLTSGAKYISSTHNPMYPTKTIVLSRDNSVRLFSSDATQLSVQILPEKLLNTVSAVYTGNQNQLFTIILKTGEILLSDASTCPMTFKQVFVSNGDRITNITLYEFFDEIRNDDGRSKSERIFYHINIRIIAGTMDGNLVVVNDITGKHDSICPAHSGSVIQLRASSVSNCLVSLGIDKCVKVWHIFADLAQPLHLFYSLHFTTPVTQVATMGFLLCVGNSSKGSNVHQLLMYNMKDRERLEHCETDDHVAEIVDMKTLETLTICATSSVDNTIRIWNHENCLVNILQINTCARIMSFSSVRGDIVFSAGRHLYKIPYENYLTPYYQAKINSSDLLDEFEDKVPEDLEYSIYQNEVDRNFMLNPVISLPLASLDVSNSDNPQVDLLIQKQISELIEARDDDIRKIKDFLMPPLKVATDRALMSRQGWEEYVDDLLNSMTETKPEVPEFDFQSITENQLKETKTFNELGVFKMLYGSTLDNIEDTPNLTERIMKLPLNGFLSNSILYKPKDPEIHIVYEEPVQKEYIKYKYPSEFLTVSVSEPPEVPS